MKDYFDTLCFNQNMTCVIAKRGTWKGDLNFEKNEKE